MADEETPQPEPAASHDNSAQEPDVNDRLVLPFLIPVVVFLFAVLLIYGLSRIYLELNTIEVGEVTMATPLAVGVSLYILLAAWYLVSNRTAPMWHGIAIGLVAVVFLTGGAIWAAVDDRGEEPHEPPPANGSEPTPGDGPAPGTIQVGLIDPEWAVTVNPASPAAGDLTVIAENQGTLIHNLRIAQTDLAADQLPLDATGVQVDEANLSIVASIPDFPAGEAEETEVALDAGSYVFFCNIAGHYDSGMHMGVTVQ